mmetsp:Transcript_2960/g.5969  ORF Transcript_2960/g.5969 Transcript_2960/m.5969 type:complete len:572 (-) Transcript_2960:240-1955(-)
MGSSSSTEKVGFEWRNEQDGRRDKLQVANPNYPTNKTSTFASSDSVAKILAAPVRTNAAPNTASAHSQSQNARIDCVIYLASKGDQAERLGDLSSALDYRRAALELLIEELKLSEPKSKRRQILQEESGKLLTKTESTKVQVTESKRENQAAIMSSSEHQRNRHYDHHIDTLVGMGFTVGASTVALEGSSGNFSAALSLLLSPNLQSLPSPRRLHQPAPPSAPSPQQQPRMAGNEAVTSKGGRSHLRGSAGVVDRGGARPSLAGRGAAVAGEQRTSLEQVILGEMLENVGGVTWQDIIGLEYAKQTLQETVILPYKHPELFSGLRSPAKGVLLFGPPGTGKTLLAKAVANESGFNFFSISASSLTSKWVGEGEKLVRALFNMAREMQPSVIFMDEVDSILSKRKDDEHEASRRLKTEFMVQLDGASVVDDDRILVMGATNLPHNLDDAVLRRLARRVYVPLPDDVARASLLTQLLPTGGTVLCDLSECERAALVCRSARYSCIDLVSLCKEASMGPVRDLIRCRGTNIANATPESVRAVSTADFEDALRRIKPSVSPESLKRFADWENELG